MEAARKAETLVLPYAGPHSPSFVVQLFDAVIDQMNVHQAQLEYDLQIEKAEGFLEHIQPLEAVDKQLYEIMLAGMRTEIGHAYAALNKAEDATSSYRIAINNYLQNLQPNYNPGWIASRLLAACNGLGSVAIYTGKPLEATNLVARASKKMKAQMLLFPSMYTGHYASLQNQLGLLHRAAGQASKAHSHFREAYSITKPYVSQAHTLFEVYSISADNLHDMLYMDFKSDSARMILETYKQKTTEIARDNGQLVVQYGPAIASVFSKLAMTYAELLNYKLASQELEHALQLFPQNVRTKDLPQATQQYLFGVLLTGARIQHLATKNLKGKAKRDAKFSKCLYGGRAQTVLRRLPQTLPNQASSKELDGLLRKCK